MRHKFNAKPVKTSEHYFPSKLEWEYFKHLELLQRAGEIVFFLRNVPFHLPGGIKYIVDFQVFYSDGSVKFIDTKGMITAEFTIKKKLVEDMYPVEIEIVKKGSF